MASTATLVYTFPAYGVTASEMRVAVENVVLDETILVPLAVTLTSDTTTTISGGVTRTLVINLVQPPTVDVLNPPMLPYVPAAQSAQYNFTGSIVSSSDDDNAAGVGAQTVTVTYFDELGSGPFTEVVTLNGTTPVEMANPNKSQIVTIVNTTVGSLGANAGQITLYADPVPGYPPPAKPTSPQPAPIVVTVPACFATLFPVAETDQSTPFIELFTGQFATMIPNARPSATAPALT